MEDWKERYMAFNNNKRAKVVEFFRQNDKDGDRRLTRKVISKLVPGMMMMMTAMVMMMVLMMIMIGFQEFVAGMMCSGFNTTEAEMEFIAASFDEDGKQASNQSINQ